MFLYISLPEKLIGKSHRPQNKTFIRGANPCVLDDNIMCDKNVIGGRRWGVAAKERKGEIIHDIESIPKVSHLWGKIEFV